MHVAYAPKYQSKNLIDLVVVVVFVSGSIRWLLSIARERSMQTNKHIDENNDVDDSNNATATKKIVVFSNVKKMLNQNLSHFMHSTK